MKILKTRNYFKSFLAIILIIAMVIITCIVVSLIIINRDFISNFFANLSNNNNKQVNVYNNVSISFSEQEYNNLLQYNFYTKDNGTVVITSNDVYKMPNIPVEGKAIINVGEKVVKIVAYNVERTMSSSSVIILTESGSVYKLDLGQTILNNSCLTKYAFDKKVYDIGTENFQGYGYDKITVAQLANGETRLIGPNSILATPSTYYIGKKIVATSNKEIYIAIDSNNKVRIGNFVQDKYFNISQEKWINDGINIVLYSYLKDANGTEIKATDCDALTKNGTVSVYVITSEGKLMCIKLSEDSLLTDNKVLDSYEIKTNKQVSGFESNKSNITLRIKFSDNSIADIKDDNLIFGMLSSNNKFFTFSKKDLKNNVDYKILTDKSGLNYKVKDYEVVESPTTIETTTDSQYVINVFMITEDNKMVMTRISNDISKDYIDKMNVVDVTSEKLIDKFEREYSNDNKYTVYIVFKDGTKVDFKTYVKKYL